MEKMKKNHTEILARLESNYFNLNTALEYNSPFQLLISTLLAAQSTDIQVNKIMIPFYKDFPDAAAIANLKVEYIESRINTIGLFRNKAKNMLMTAKMIHEIYKGEVPKTRVGLESLPGVGRKTASVVLSIAFGVPAIAVDTHVFRVSNRLKLANADTVEETEIQLMKAIPKKKWSAAHHWLIWHGRKLCKAQKPLCTDCFLNDVCPFFQQFKDEILYWKGK
jgi:endonuclease-3